MEAWLDGTHDPIWWQIWPPRYTDAEVFDAMDKLDNLIRERVAKQAPMALLVDVSRTRVGSPVQRKRISNTFRLTQSIARDLVICPPERGPCPHT
ncbi:MAG: hypothetical protein AAF411_16035 [Myxococcota bacterium]